MRQSKVECKVLKEETNINQSTILNISIYLEEANHRVIITKNYQS